MALLGSPLPWASKQFEYNDGTPIISGSLQFYLAGTTTPVNVYTTSALTTPCPLDSNGRVALDANGRVVAFLSPGVGYDVLCYGTVSGVANVRITGGDLYGIVTANSNTVFDDFGTDVLYPGAKSVTTGYTILPADTFVTINAASGTPNVNLPAAADHPQVLIVKNLGPNNATITPNGAETIDGTAGINSNALEMPSTGRLPTIVLVNDGTSAYFIVAGWA